MIESLHVRKQMHTHIICATKQNVNVNEFNLIEVSINIISSMNNRNAFSFVHNTSAILSSRESGWYGHCLQIHLG